MHLEFFYYKLGLMIPTHQFFMDIEIMWTLNIVNPQWRLVLALRSISRSSTSWLDEQFTHSLWTVSSYKWWRWWHGSIHILNFTMHHKHFTFINLFTHSNPMKLVLLSSPFHSWGYRSTGRLSNLPKVTQLIRGRGGGQTVWLWSR